MYFGLLVRKKQAIRRRASYGVGDVVWVSFWGMTGSQCYHSNKNNCGVSVCGRRGLEELHVSHSVLCFSFVSHEHNGEVKLSSSG